MKNIEMPLVSIFIPYYNDNKYFKKAINSVLSSSYQNFELILLNHATLDNCREIAHSYEDKRIKHIDMLLNLGAGSGLLMKKALNIAKGKYFKPLCADDMITSDGIEKLVNYMENNTDKDFAFGNVEYINENDKDLHANWFTTREGFSPDITEVQAIEMLSRPFGFLPYVGSIIKTNILKEIEINKTLVMLFDMSLWLELLCNGSKIGFLNEKVANYRIHKGQISSTSNEKFSAYTGFFERSIYWKTLLKIKDIELVKKLFPQEKYCEKLTTAEDIPFVVAHAIFENYKPYTYEYISGLLHDEKMCEHMQKVFDYGIREFREDYLKNFKNNKAMISGLTPFKQYKWNIYRKSPKQLLLRDILFLAVRRFIKNLTFHDLRQRYSIHRKFSL